MTGDEQGSQVLLDHNSSTQYTDVGQGVQSNLIPSTAISAMSHSSTVSTEDEDKVFAEKQDKENTVKVYKRRWYVLLVFSSYTFTQSIVCNTWGPISTSSNEAFGWDNAMIAWINNWGPISYVLAGLFYPWLLQVKGLKWATLSSMFLVTAGTCFRVITSDPLPATILIHFGHFLNGLAGPIAMSGIPALSAVWFPPRERLTATAISASLCELGSAVAFVIGPAVVSDAPPAEVNMTNVNPLSYNQSIVFESSPNTSSWSNETEARIEKERHEIMLYMYYVCGWSALVFVVMVCYFPAKPPQPPCVSAMQERDRYWLGMWSLRRKGHFLLLTLTYSISIGVLVCWNSVLNMNLSPTGISEVTAGWIGFYSTISGCTGSLLVGRFADHFVRHLKLFIFILYILATCCFIVLALVLIKVIPFSEALLYVSVIGGSTLLNAAVPLIYEFACELAYPTSEVAANGVLTFFNNLCGLIFLALFSIPKIGTMWMNWTMIGSAAVCLPLIGLIKGQFNRLEVDEGGTRKALVEKEVTVSVGHSVQAT